MWVRERVRARGAIVLALLSPRSFVRGVWRCKRPASIDNPHSLAHSQFRAVLCVGDTPPRNARNTRTPRFSCDGLQYLLRPIWPPAPSQQRRRGCDRYPSRARAQSRPTHWRKNGGSYASQHSRSITVANGQLALASHRVWQRQNLGMAVAFFK